MVKGSGTQRGTSNDGRHVCVRVHCLRSGQAEMRVRQAKLWHSCISTSNDALTLTNVCVNCPRRADGTLSTNDTRPPADGTTQTTFLEECGDDDETTTAQSGRAYDDETD